MSARLGHMPELIRPIVECSDTKTRIALLFACKGFFDLVSPLLWQKVKGAEWVFALIEGAKVSINEEEKHVTICLPSLIWNGNMSRLMLYAPYVESLELCRQNGYDYRLVRWEALFHHSESNPLLPNLTRLTLENSWWCDQSKYSQLPLSLMFVSPSLLEYRIMYDSSHRVPAIRQARVRAVLATLSRRCPKLNTLEIFSQHGTYDNEEASLMPKSCDVATIFRTMKLRTLATSLTLLADIVDMRALKQLRRLTVRYDDECDDFKPLSSPNIEWPYLWQLSILLIHSLDQLVNLWAAPGLVRNLTFVAIELRSNRFQGDQISIDSIESMAAMMAQNSPKLVSLWLKRCGAYSSIEISSAIVAILSHLKLKELRITFGECTRAVDSHEEVFGRVFTHLRTLEIRKYQIVIGELLHYAQSMPNLGYLKLQLKILKDEGLNFSTYPPPSLIAIKITLQNMEIQDMTLEEAWVYASRVVLTIWPNVKLSLGSRVTETHAGFIKVLNSMRSSRL